MPEPRPTKSFSEAAAERPPGFLGELVEMLKHNKKWWVIPIVGFLLLLGGLLVLGSTAAAPFIYTLF